MTTNTDTNPNGNGVGTGNSGDLRWCMNQLAGSTDTTNQIMFAPGVSGIIDLTQPLPNISKPVTISGPGAGVLTIARDANAGQFRIFTVNQGVTAEIDSLSLENGSVNNIGGGILNNGTLSLHYDQIFQNQATGVAGSGGGIFNATNATLDILN